MKTGQSCSFGTLAALAGAMALLASEACTDALVEQRVTESTDLAGDGLGDLPSSDAAEPDDPGWTGRVADIQGDGAAEPCPGGTHCQCSSGAECDSGFCIDIGEEKVCTKVCNGTCAEGYTCATVPNSSGDLVSVCVKPYLRICDPCLASKDCEALGVAGAACVSNGASGAFCGVPCQGDKDCPAGYGCKAGTNIEGGATMQCAPLTGECKCSKAAIAAGKKTLCTQTVAGGSGKPVVCKGERKCTTSGLAVCTASAATAETCDGLDNDCDGDTDEAACDDKNPCTDDLCSPGKGGNGQGCSHKTKTATPCNADDNACTVNDKCVDGTCTPGPEVAADVCDDDNPCTSDQCNPTGGCLHANSDGAKCNAGLCTKFGTCSAGKCLGQPKDCTSPGPCYTAYCSAATGECANKLKSAGSACDDGDACSLGDSCDGESCEGKPAICEDDNPCTSDGKCDKDTGCVFSPFAASTCTDNNECTVADKCVAGKCVGDPADAGIACDDSNPCTTDTCSIKAGCKHDFVADNTSCTDGDTCTEGDLCSKGTCVPGTNSCCDPVTNPCSNDDNLCNGIATCVKKDGKAVCEILPASVVKCAEMPAGSCIGEVCNIKTGKCEVAQLEEAASCQDGNICTLGEACKNGKCTGGTVNPCNDGNACTADACEPKAGCQNSPIAAVCSDDDACTLNDVCKEGVCGGKALDCATDNNPCTDDTCDKVKGCVATPNAAICDDGSPCTVGDKCSGGTCVPGTIDKIKCECDASKGNADCAKMEDGNLCNGSLYCTPQGKCAIDPASIVKCDSGADKPCAKNQCDAVTGKCAFLPVPEGTSCNADGSACTEGDHCAAGQCVAGTKLVCGDGNPCTSDACDLIKGCNYPATTGNCNDGDGCTLGDSCVAGACKGGAAKNCDDANLCTDDSCVAASGGCKNMPNTAQCSDGNACTDKDSCKAGVCSAGTSVDCDDGNACTKDSCDPTAGCKATPSTDPCDDGKICTKGDACSAGKCAPGAALKCDDGNPCTGDDTCKEPTGCENVPKPGLCNDDNACTTNDTCSNGTCSGQATKVCDDGNPCTQNTCDAAGGCVYPANSAKCNDNNACTEGDTCVNKSCQPGGPTQCPDDSNPCTDPTCNTVIGCTFAPNSAPCDDKNACTVNDVCGGGNCKAGALKNCSDNNDCTTDTCDLQTGCQSQPNSNNCDDKDGCTVGDKCQGGSCMSGALKNCQDGNPCTINEQCVNGSCNSQPMDCSYLNDACNTGVCQNGSCGKQAKSGGCSDNNACTTGDYCSGGNCQSGSLNSCNDNNQCTDDKCDPGLNGCVNTKLGDGADCGTNSKCVNGQCKNFPTTCAGRCGAAYDPLAPCQCNTACPSYGNCCGDFLSQCNICSPSCGPCQKCSGGSCVADSSKDCQSCGGTSVCQSGTCVARQSFTVDGCSGSNFVPGCTTNCYACKPEGGFSGTNQSACAGLTCFNRWQNDGEGAGGMLVMYSRSSQTAFVEWSFGGALACNWLIEAKIPKTIPSLSNTCQPAASTYVKNAQYNLKGTTQNKVLDHSAIPKNAWAQLFSGNLTGATGVTLGNQATPNNGCTFLLVDAIRLTPK